MDTYFRVASPTCTVLPYDGYHHFQASSLCHVQMACSHRRPQLRWKKALSIIVVCRVVEFIANDGEKGEGKPPPDRKLTNDQDPLAATVT